MATESASCGGNGGQHPVATRLADAFGVSYDEIMGWHCKGYGFGNIAKAYLLAQKTGLALPEPTEDDPGARQDAAAREALLKIH